MRLLFNNMNKVILCQNPKVLKAVEAPKAINKMEISGNKRAKKVKAVKRVGKDIEKGLSFC
jgi:hypothetical protein